MQETSKIESLITSQLQWSRYLKFVSYYRANPVEEGEVHHIVPVSEGGSDLQENLVLLPKQAHYIAHWLLKKSINSVKMTNAFYAMTNLMGKRRGKLYASSREEVVKAVKEWRSRPEVKAMYSARLTGPGNPMFGKTGEANPFFGKRHTKENKVAQSIRAKKENNPHWYKPHTEEIKKKIGDAQRGEKNHMFGKEVSEETKQKHRIANTGSKNNMYGYVLCKNPETGECKRIKRGEKPEEGFFLWHPRGGYYDKSIETK